MVFVEGTTLLDTWQQPTGRTLIVTHCKCKGTLLQGTLWTWSFSALQIFAFLVFCFLCWREWLHTRQRWTNPFLLGVWMTFPVMREKPPTEHDFDSVWMILHWHLLELVEWLGGNQWQPQRICSQDCRLLVCCLCPRVETRSMAKASLAVMVGNNSTIIGGDLHCWCAWAIKESWLKTSGSMILLANCMIRDSQIIWFVVQSHKDVSNQMICRMMTQKVWFVDNDIQEDQWG